MRKLIYSTSVFLLMAMLVLSCKKDSASATDTNVPAGKSAITCTYSGAASGSFASALSLSSCLKSSALINVSGGALYGAVSVSQGLMILPLGIGVGTHTQGSSGTADDITFTLSINNGAQAWSVAGATATGFTVNVTRNDATGVEGTFSGQLGNDSDNSVVTISNGSFKGTF